MANKLVTAVLAGAFAGLLGVAQAAPVTFSFDPNGTGNATVQNIATIDQAPGNALGVGAVTAINNFLSGGGSTAFTLLYQANLSTFQDINGTTLYANGLGGAPTFTFVASFGETVQSATGLPGSATFAFDPTNPNNFFRMYATPAIGDNLAGTGFDAGTLILEGQITGIDSSGFNLASADPVLMDQAGADDWGGQQTVTGSGASDLTVEISFFDPNYFTDLALHDDLIVSFFNTSQVDPFRQVNPSQAFFDGTIPNIGAVNGRDGPDFLFQADANQSIATLAVPEPGSLALLASGLLAIRAAARRRQSK